ncbi:MAG: hypothetical protein R3C14_33740 [Caldilineaceae bacterium]
MHSSIFSSRLQVKHVDSTVTAGRTWRTVWLLALLLVALSLSSLEVLLRMEGHRPSIVDDVHLWSYYRAKINEAPSTTVALLGDSRMQLDIDTAVMRQRLPGITVIQLAVDGSNPLPTLVDLLNDQTFHGLIICTVTEDRLNSFGERPSGVQQEYVTYYHQPWKGSAYLDRLVSLWLQAHLVIINPSVRLERLTYNLFWKQQLPTPDYLITLPDRSRQADYATEALDRLRTRRIQQAQESLAMPVPTPEEWLDNALTLEPQLQRFQARGGKVAFVYFPISDATLAAANQRFPRAHYWDKFAQATSAQTVHFLDTPALATFDPPDTSHLDYRDTPAFTNALVDQLDRFGFFDQVEPHQPH